MNQDEVKAKLLLLEPEAPEFTLLFTGKESRKVNGLYKPETREILIHNRNFQDTNSLVYTAIHEFSHHLHFSRTGAPISGRSHTAAFWSLFHTLLSKAETMGVYANVFKSDRRFEDLTIRIRRDFIEPNGELMKAFGKVLSEAMDLCKATNSRFEDYVDRVLCLPRMAATTAMHVFAANVNPAVGYENMKTLSCVRDPGLRKEAERALLSGTSPDLVKTSILRPKREKSERESLVSEKQRLERTLATVKKRLQDVERKLENLED